MIKKNGATTHSAEQNNPVNCFVRGENRCFEKTTVRFRDIGQLPNSPSR